MRKVSTAFDDDDGLPGGRTAVQIQYLDVWRSRSEAQVTCFFETDPIFVNLLDLGPFVDMDQNLVVWNCVPSDAKNCVDLVEPVRCDTRFTWSDELCPAFVVLKKLRQDGWQAVVGQVLHTTIDDQRFDSRDAQKKQRYFQVLCNLSTALVANPVIPSDQSIPYYALVYRNITVAAGGKAVEYRKMLKGKGADASEPLALEDADGLPALQNGNAHLYGSSLPPKKYIIKQKQKINDQTWTYVATHRV